MKKNKFSFLFYFLNVDILTSVRLVTFVFFFGQIVSILLRDGESD